MFSAIPRIEARVFSRLPNHLRMRNRRSDWSFGKGRQDLDSYLEGPAFDRQGRLHLVDIPHGRIFRVSADGATWEVIAEYDGWPTGLAFHRDGRLFVADHRRGILQLDLPSGRMETVVDRVRREGLKGVNDLTFSNTGDLYFTDQGQTGLQDPTGRVYRLRADGVVDCLLDNIPSPNGLALSVDEQVLFVAATRANQIWRLPLHADGTTSKVSAFLTLQGGLGPDGLALDRSGGLAIAHVGRGTVWLYDRLGDLQLRIDSPSDQATTNLAFGGSDGRSLYITASDTGAVLITDETDLLFSRNDGS